MKIGQSLIGKLVLVRCDRAGVHIGTLVDRIGKCAELSDARRLHRWRGANTLSEVATTGVAQDYTRISEPVSTIVLTDAIEVMPVTARAAQTLGSRWGA